jgi:hypothetical protein
MNQEIISFPLPTGTRFPWHMRLIGHKLSHSVAHPDFLVLFGIGTYKALPSAKIDAGKRYPWTAFAYIACSIQCQGIGRESNALAQSVP